MNKDILLILAIALAGCSSGESSKSETDNFQFSYTIDTVMVDAGEHLFFVKTNFGFSDVDAENKLLYNLNIIDHNVEVIDLEELNLKEVIQYQEEGPDGMGGGFVMKINQTPDGQTILYDITGIKRMDAEGHKLGEVKLDPKEWKGDELKAGESVNLSSLSTKDGKIFYGLFGTQGPIAETEGLVILNTADQTRKLIRTDFLDFLKDFMIEMEMNGRTMRMGEQTRLNLINDQLLISTSAKNAIWKYDIQTDSLTEKTYESTLTSNIKKGNFPRQTSSREDLNSARAEKSKEVTFGDVIYDKDRMIFWRFSKEMDRLAANDSIVYKTILTAFDEELNQLGEERISGNYITDLSPYLVDGQFWHFLNLEDEVAFIRLKPNFEND
ncbi:DUF4221 family protein [Algoriphagus aquimarinus]|uniref:DUF4221 domain-containing protein n=1 Tax=Algoriphagus aquimarinus TaxID=237018 RepID=A0A1I1CFB1_9BACT|nr:DUF4221 family protein [Algoriphagus aquimarinus]SFB60696.1 protein of unknown function [Algoriphagus aquimarinus]